MSHLLVDGQQPIVPLPEREPAAIRAAVARLDPAALSRFEADWTRARGMSTACFLRGTSWSTGSAGSLLNAGRNWRLGCAPASASSRSRRTVRSAGQLRPRSAISCGRPRQPLHERLDVGIRPGRSQCRGRASPVSDWRGGKPRVPDCRCRSGRITGTMSSSWCESSNSGCLIRQANRNGGRRAATWPRTG